MFKKAFINQ